MTINSLSQLSHGSYSRLIRKEKMTVMHKQIPIIIGKRWERELKSINKFTIRKPLSNVNNATHPAILKFTLFIFITFLYQRQPLYGSKYLKDISQIHIQL